MTAKARFTQQDVTRAIKGALAAGLVVRSVAIAHDGTIKIDTVPLGTGTPSEINPWDVELNMPSARIGLPPTAVSSRCYAERPSAPPAADAF